MVNWPLNTDVVPEDAGAVASPITIQFCPSYFANGATISVQLLI